MFKRYILKNIYFGCRSYTYKASIVQNVLSEFSNLKNSSYIILKVEQEDNNNIDLIDPIRELHRKKQNFSFKD